MNGRPTLSSSSLKNQHGFTLIELMVVIVIIGVLASLVVFNVDGVDQRKAMQVRELLILDLKRINREANDQARVYALETQAMTDVSSGLYRVIEYTQTPSANTQNGQAGQSRQNSLAVKPSWQVNTQFSPRELPAQVSLQIESQEHRYQNANNTDLLGANAPKLIWLGNGEAKPVSIQVYFAQKPIGAPVLVDYLGKIDAQS
ncbi:type II secretion system protein G (GspG) [Acinetobacter calcoaceticus]|uniref:Type II secretion system protein G (GspG) n=1 Tax=Acinetobacter calcoaceticus TaxID=471 RepID=A0A4R1XK94_ACICA|nr:type II secretion system protein G (GspG) [Acinetobacter calcoaceticus]